MSLDEKQTARKIQAAKTRQQLLEAATKLFAENGYARTSVRSINKSIGMADGLMYHYFPGGKEEIIKVIVCERFQQVILELQELVKGLNNLSIEEIMENFYQHWTQIFEKHQDVFRILIKENTVMQLIGHDSLVSMIRDTERWFPKYLKEQAASGAIQTFDFDIATEMLLAVISGHFLTKITGLGPGILDDDNQRKKLFEYQIKLWKSPK
jgi:Transcriptional regulator